MTSSPKPVPQLSTEEIEKLLETKQALETFLSVICFETRTPASLIVGYSEVLLNPKMGPLNEQQREGLDNINQAGKILWKISQELQVVTHILVAPLELYIEQISVAQIIQEAIVAAREHWYLGYSSEKLLPIETKVPDNLPSIWADALRIQQALARVIVASITATYRSRETSKIVLTANYDHDWLYLVVTTTGGEAVHLHDDNDITLLLSRTIMEKHGGRLEVTKNETSELIITLALPINPSRSEVDDKGGQS